MVNYRELNHRNSWVCSLSFPVEKPPLRAAYSGTSSMGLFPPILSGIFSYRGWKEVESCL